MLRILSWNIANFDDHKDWEIRIQYIVKEITFLKPDIILLQEVRFHKKKDQNFNAGDQILKILSKQSDYFDKYNILTQPAMYYRGSEFWEGLSIITPFTVIDKGSSPFKIKHPSFDSNQRIAQYITFSHEQETFRIFNTHFSYFPTNARSNMNECLKLAQTNFCENTLIAGDFNSTPGSWQMRAFHSSTFLDCWSLLRNKKKGYTFPSENPRKRIDYIWISKHLSQRVVSIKQIGNIQINQGLFPSDHLGLFLTIK